MRVGRLSRAPASSSAVSGNVAPWGWCQGDGCAGREHGKPAQGVCGCAGCSETEGQARGQQESWRLRPCPVPTLFPRRGDGQRLDVTNGLDGVIIPRRGQTELPRGLTAHEDSGGGSGKGGKGGPSPEVGANGTRAAAQADPGAGLATGRPLEERDRLVCDWFSPLPEIGRRAVVPPSSHPGVCPVLEPSRSRPVRAPSSSERALVRKPVAGAWGRAPVGRARV